MEQLVSSSGFIYINMIVDTEAIIERYKNPSTVEQSPTMVNDTSLFYFVATKGNTITGSGTGNLKISATVGDGVRWAGVSESNNFENSVMVYKIQHQSGQEVMSDAKFMVYTKEAAVPASNKEPFPPKSKDQAYWFMSAEIIGKGMENYTVHFAVFNRPKNGPQTLYGYFKWDPAIEVKG
ncbi:inclusion body family protein [Chromobacterium haemolyticum]|uniref:inclusion body family protein n=1 Tax=Chromobacterium haemolyticum TaxID=394935 RepID=UPI00307FAFEF